VYGDIHPLSVFDAARMSAGLNETGSGNLNPKVVPVRQQKAAGNEDRHTAGRNPDGLPVTFRTIRA
jgi:hypothetical protein